MTFAEYKLLSALISATKINLALHEITVRNALLDVHADDALRDVHVEIKRTITALDEAASRVYGTEDLNGRKDDK